jgi:SRSO17 transposase
LACSPDVGQPSHDHVLVRTTKPETAADARVGAKAAKRKRDELLELLRPCFRRIEPFVQARKYLAAVMSDLPERNGWSIAKFAGDKTPDKTQRLLNQASWDAAAAMGTVRRFGAAGLEAAARRRGLRKGRLKILALDETGQEKKGEFTAGVKRQHMGCADGVANGINTVHAAWIREGTGQVLAGFRQWIPEEHIKDPVKSLVTALPLDLRFRTKGELAIEICTETEADGLRPDFVCGDEVYGSCTKLREHLEQEKQGYVLRVAKNFRITMRDSSVLTCEDAVAKLLKSARRWEVRSAGKGSKGDRWYAWAWIGTASSGHSVLIRRHLKTGELAFHYCYVPEGQLCSKARLIRAAGLRWPVEEEFEFGKGQFGLDQSQVRLYHAIARHTVLACAALAVCAVTAALLRDRTDTQAAPPIRPDQPPPADPGLIPLTVPQVRRLLAAATAPSWPPGHIRHWDEWTRRHQARARWFHKRARLARDAKISLVS